MIRLKKNRSAKIERRKTQIFTVFCTWASLLSFLQTTFETNKLDNYCWLLIAHIFFSFTTAIHMKLQLLGTSFTNPSAFQLLNSFVKQLMHFDYQISRSHVENRMKIFLGSLLLIEGTSVYINKYQIKKVYMSTADIIQSYKPSDPTKKLVSIPWRNI